MSQIVTEEMIPAYEAFVQQHKKGHFAQSVLWAKQKPQWTWKAIISTDSDGQIRGSLAVLIRKVPFTGLTLMYGCRGPVCDPENKEVLADLIDGARKLARTYHSYCIKLDPDITVTNTDFLETMESFGFRHTKTGKNFEGIQPKFVFRLDVEGKTTEELLADFHQKTRYNLRLAGRKGVEVSLCGKEAVPDFSRLMNITGERDGFGVRQASYFEGLLDHLGEHARLYMAYYEGQAIAGTLAIWYGDKVWYLYGASSNEHRRLMPNYLLQWRMIEWAVEKNCRIYDFRGVSGDLNPDSPLYGLYKFKRGFGGDFTEFIGELDLVLNKPADYMIRKAIKFRKTVRTIVRSLKHRERD